MHVYAFGSLCRGEINEGSDIDLLAIVNGRDERFDPDIFSIYSYERIKEIWKEGNPFAWHLFLESKPIFFSDDKDFLKSIGSPEKYKNGLKDCCKFLSLFEEAKESIASEGFSKIFDLSTVFLSIRNIATCFSLYKTDSPDFSRHAGRKLEDPKLLIPESTYKILERARILCTRGYGDCLRENDIENVAQKLDAIHEWMQALVNKAKD